jgi:hypothetical protein
VMACIFRYIYISSESLNKTSVGVIGFGASI